MRTYKNTGLLLMFSVLLVLFICAVPPTGAQQGGVPAVAQVDANLRAGPGRNYKVVASVRNGTSLTVSARSGDSAWALATAPDLRRGWASARQITFTPAIEIASLPVSEEIIGQSAPAAPQNNQNLQTITVPSLTDTPDPRSVPTTNPEDAKGVAAVYMQAPVLPRINGQMRAVAKRIMAKGKELGNNPGVFSKIGDCMTDYSYFLAPFGNGRFDLGKYTNLLPVIQHFSVPLRGSSFNSFNIESLASYSGMTAVGLQEPGWAVRGGALCTAEDSMLSCNFRVDKPSVALIMVGFADSQLITPADFGPALRRLVKASMDNGVIPILSTFPEFEGRKKESRLMNNVIYTVANQMHVPLINLDAALAKLHAHGVDKDSHLSIPAVVEQSAIFNEENLGYGITMRNLVTLQALDIVWRELMGGG